MWRSEPQGPPLPAGWPGSIEAAEAMDPMDPMDPMDGVPLKRPPHGNAHMLTGLRAAIHLSPPLDAWTGRVASGLALCLQAMGAAVEPLAERGRLRPDRSACDLLVRLQVSDAEPPPAGSVQIGYGLLQLASGRRAARRLQQAIRARGLGDADEGPCWLVFPVPRAPGGALSLAVIWDGRRRAGASPQQWAEALALGAATYLLDASERPWVGAPELPGGGTSAVRAGRDAAATPAALPAERGVGQPAGPVAAAALAPEPAGQAEGVALGVEDHGVKSGRPAVAAGSEPVPTSSDPSPRAASAMIAEIAETAETVEEAEPVRSTGARPNQPADDTSRPGTPGQPDAGAQGRRGPSESPPGSRPATMTNGLHTTADGRLVAVRALPDWYRQLLGPNATTVHIPEAGGQAAVRRPSPVGEGAAPQPAVAAGGGVAPGRPGTRVIRHR